MPIKGTLSVEKGIGNFKVKLKRVKRLGGQLRKQRMGEKMKRKKIEEKVMTFRRTEGMIEKLQGGNG